MEQRHREGGEKDGQHNKDERMNGAQRDKMTKGRKDETGECVCEKSKYEFTGGKMRKILLWV